MKMKTNTRYEIIIYWSEEDQYFIAEVPELAGCMADGSTYSEALNNVEVIISEWLETAIELGRPIPKPKGKLMFA
jgi:predicted RNase H-like HicB family nuclease